MAYSPRQLDMIRASLRAHKAYTTAVDGKPLTWQGLAYDIEDHSGVVMTAEVLRQFVNGVSKKNNPGRQRVPSDENIVAMVNYLTDPEIDALEKTELTEETLDYKLRLRLLKFLQIDSSPFPESYPNMLTGTYCAVHVSEKNVSHIQMVLRLDLREGETLEVDETHYVYSNTGDHDIAKWDERKKKSLLKSKKKSCGWSIRTPEDNLLFFCKSLPYLTNHYYILLCEVNMDSPACDRLILIRHDYPLEVNIRSNDVISEIYPGLARNIFIFDKVSK